MKEVSEKELLQVSGGFYNPLAYLGQKTLTGSVKQANGTFKEGNVTVSKDLYKLAEAEAKANGGKPGTIYKTMFRDLNPK